MKKRPYIPNHLLGERGRSNRFGFACFKTDAEDTERKELLDEIKTMIETRVAKTDLVEQMKEFKDLPIVDLRALADPKTGVMAIIKKQGEEIEQLKNRGVQNQRPKTTRELVTEWHTRNKASIDKIKSGERAELTPIETRVASPMTPATVDSGTSAYIPTPFIEPGVNDIPRVQPTFWDTLRKGRTNSAVYVWVNKTNPLGAAGFIGPGVLKPGVSFELITDVSNAKKIAVSSKAATELLDDIDGMVDMIEGEMRYQLLKELNSKLLTGTVSATVPAGITTLATTFTIGASLSTSSANNFDAILGAIAQLRSGYLTGRIVVYINPLDSVNMQMSKASTSGNYIIPPFATAGGTTIGGAQIIEDVSIPVGYLLCALIDYYVIKIYKDYTVSMGWENDDFTRNLVTWVGEMRLHQFFNTQYTGAFIYDTFANIKTGLA